MQSSTLDALPSPPSDRDGWPWTKQSDPVPETRSDGTSWPAISIVTPSYNQGQFIEETIRSVLLQRYPNLEYIIVDGGSTDESVEVIEKYDPWIDHWVSEPDEGQPDAINKGIVRATGDWFNWINSDDLLAPSALEIVGDASVGADVVAGVNQLFGSAERSVPNRALTWENLLYWQGGVIFQQPSFWIRTGLLREMGGLDANLQYCFDYKMAIQYLRRYDDVEYVDAVLAHFRHHAQSKTVSASVHFKYEMIEVWDEFESAHSDALVDGKRLQILQQRNWRRVAWNRYLGRLKRVRVPFVIKLISVLAHSLRWPELVWSRFTAGALRQMFADSITT